MDWSINESVWNENTNKTSLHFPVWRWDFESVCLHFASNSFTYFLCKQTEMAGAVVGGAFLSASLQVLFDRLASREVLSFIRGHNLSDELLKKMKRKLRVVHAVLNDAEMKQFTNPTVKEWLDELRVVVYEAEDLLDEIASEALRCKMEADSQTSTSQVRSFMSTWLNSPFGSQSIESRIEEIIDKLENVAEDKDDLGLKEGVGEKLPPGLPSTSLVDESCVYGRDCIKEEMIKLLLSDDTMDNQIIGVFSIAGMGGLGKTTLAQLLYNDDKVKEHFDLRAWVFVSKEFDLIRITRSILEEITASTFETNNLNQLQVKMKESIQMKKFLLVLDDIWTEDYNSWDRLRTSLVAGAKGSKIIITTRNANIAKVADAIYTHHLGELSYEDCWSLFTKLVFENRDSTASPQLEAIGKKIVEKCQGLPLAVKTIGSLLRSKAEPREWDDILNSEMWHLANDGILSALKLSYCDLPLCLKRCFAYCSIFPTNYEFDKEKLILLWMAEGLLQESRSKKKMEEVGEMYFDELLSRSFFQKSSSNKSSFVMHHLINDLAQLVSGEFSVWLEDGKVQILSENARHLSYFQDEYDAYKRFDTLSEVRSLRTFLALQQRDFSQCHLSNKVLLHFLPQVRFLRVLSLFGYCIIDLPDSIGNLKHLRYLDLSCTAIQRLPDSVCCMYNLQTMILSGCSSLIELPAEMEKLINLRYLDVSGTKMTEMPSVGELKSLQSLTHFVVGQMNGSKVGELMKLSDIRGRLCISKLDNVRSGRDALKANLKDKRYLDELVLTWDNNNGAAIHDGDILENFQPHTNLKRLYINSFGGLRFPDWVGDPSFFNLMYLELRDCDHCTSLPPLGQLPSLKHLVIFGMHGVGRVGSEFYGNDSSSAKPFFKSLQTLIFESMEGWNEWLPCGEFPHLQELYIRYCPKLTGKLPKQLPSLKILEIVGCPELLVASLGIPTIRELKLLNCGKVLLREPAYGLIDLQMLEVEISYISQWTELPPGLQKLSITECNSLEYLLEERMLQTKACFLQDLAISHSSFSRPLRRFGLSSVLKSLKIIRSRKLEFFLPELLKGHQPFLERFCVEESTCNSVSLSFSLGNFPSLSHLEIRHLGGLESLSISISSGDPTSLKSFVIWGCPDLVYIELPAVSYACYSISSCEKLTTLTHTLLSMKRLSLKDCPELLFQREGLPSNLSELEIGNCSKLTGACENMESFPRDLLLPCTLTSLQLSDIPSLRSLDGEWLQQLTSLRALYIHGCPKLQFFREEGLKHLNSRSLEKLEIRSCPELQSLARASLQHPTALKRLKFRDSPKLQSSIELQHQRLVSLEELGISHYPRLQSLTEFYPQCLASLKEVGIWDCPELRSLTEAGLQHLTCLQKLWICSCSKLQYLTKERLPDSLSYLIVNKCPLLEPRCQFEKGQDWPYIAHIPHILIDYVLF